MPSWRAWIVSFVTLLGCRDRQVSDSARASPLETGIARDLTARFGTPVRVACNVAAGIPVSCDATLADGTRLPIAMEKAGKDEWGWRVDGVVLDRAELTRYVEGELAAIGVRETASCGAPVHVVPPGGRVSCSLSGGGAAFVTVGAGGQTSLELALDPAAAAARSELVTPDRDRELTRQSLDLEQLEGESDGEDEVVADGGVPNP